jgi:hypothetical protein
LTDFIGSAGLILVVSAAIFGPLSGWLAGRRDRQPIVWLLLGALLGPVAFSLLWLAPPGRCPLCDSPVKGWPSRCVVCGGALGGVSDAGTGSRGRRPTPSSRTAVDAAPSASTGPIPLPVGRTGRSLRERRPVTVAEPFARGGRSDAHVALDAGQVLATAVYFGGTARLTVGSRYVIVRQRATLQLLGPVDQDPSALALERPLAALTATAIGERLVITEGDDARVSLALALGAFAGASGPQLEIALSMPEEQAMDRPASR